MTPGTPNGRKALITGITGQGGSLLVIDAGRTRRDAARHGRRGPWPRPTPASWARPSTGCHSARAATTSTTTTTGRTRPTQRRSGARRPRPHPARWRTSAVDRRGRPRPFRPARRSAGPAAGQSWLWRASIPSGPAARLVPSPLSSTEPGTTSWLCRPGLSSNSGTRPAYVWSSRTCRTMRHTQSHLSS